MEVTRASLGIVAVVALLFAIFSPPVHAQTLSPAPSPTSDGTSIDQAVAYVLMAVALVLTYLIHAADFAYRL